MRACRALLLVALATAILWPSGAWAQVFSPGALARPHEKLEGLGSCVQCHEQGAKQSDAKCLACHEIIATQSKFHRSPAVKGEPNCASCHKEHRGKDASLIQWQPSKRAFNHALTGWPLAGAHRKVDCKSCHEEQKRTYIGLSTSCADCHFDEHRGQEGNDCARCHTSVDFKKPPFFNHNDRDFASFALTGKHRGVACTECHQTVVDEKAKPQQDREYLQLSDLPKTCIGCHEDVHRGQFGKDCVRCHTTSGWRIIKDTAEDSGFHDKTDFPLRGEHASVDCKTCHGVGKAAVFKGLKHGRCADCHIDAHVGQLRDGRKSPDCKTCHEVSGFVPVLFTGKMHDDTAFPLDGSHEAVACNLCHTKDASLARKVPTAVKREVARKNRRLLISDTKLSFEKEAVGRCETCHADPHAGQFAERIKDKGCNGCHTPESFADVRFDHEDSRFPLTGQHAKVSCNGCHVPAPGAKGSRQDVVIYRPLEIACAACHVDRHVGQLRPAGEKGVACDTCHTTAGFRPAKFDHQKQSRFPLEGKHKAARCTSCHALVDVGPFETARYKPLPVTCRGCHEEEHKGTFDAYVPEDVVAQAKAEQSLVRKDSLCIACHTPNGWQRAKIAHERTGFPLRGRHTGVGCADCHGADTSRPIPTSCAGCHEDPHAQEFGLMCRSCHSEDSFAAPSFLVDSHRRTNFPLIGRHAALPCEQCHTEKRERTFTRAALDCVACHANDARRASLVTVDHTRSPFSGSCVGCHEPVGFQPARFPQHETCFPIARGVHAGVTCTECHRGLNGATASGACNDVPVRCAECHVHDAATEERNHEGIPGYGHESEKCAACHRAG